ncbi:hypothetical protein VOLCADRAFT_98842 [Volvox carteri f. nagariensis]|uniref:C-type lectin domain-containing protein n=1 Tax=Volvox carteri f. nagariensis TaxID=3068 RepID=D8UGF1_VOLCA|nr:uncharacterized protein VOLCADRAFT_98842 [Volvox carteri f. nagariensis]EFJ41166.1 hypothetical protein VOLCADRAFT_98842 [Volvox carteri f. nagariensis]|eukprot:XP_002957734.1 hypothetical protein VOLCADRAFT_98842 [Volvox carteri f. nagariensis]
MRPPMLLLLLLLPVLLPAASEAARSIMDLRGGGNSRECDPLTFPYKTLFYDNPSDCRNYVLFDVDAGCMPDWRRAKEVCDSSDMELAPAGEESSLDPSSDLCYLMSQEGDVHLQGCDQPVRFVCRSRYAGGDDPNVLTHEDETGSQYRLYGMDAKQATTYDGAAAFCTGLGAGWDLVPYGDDVGYHAVQRLCSARLFTCWLKRANGFPYCPLMAADGTLQMQGCDQLVRFVCRRPRQIA